MDCSPPGSSVHGILQKRILEWVAMPSFRDIPSPGIEPASLMSPALAGRFFTTCITWETHILLFSSVQLHNRVQLCNPRDCSMPDFPVHHQLLELAQLISIESVMPSNHLILYCPILPLPSIFPNIRIFSNESVLRIRWPKYWSFSFSISPSSEYSGLISFRMD